LIRPRNLYFSERCIAVHGIRPRDVINAPEWDAVWAELAPMVEGVTLVAHNAMFDMAVLASTLAAYELVCPQIDFQCTRLIARRCWPGRTGYGLKPTAQALGISFRHHDALEDSRACAEIALAAAKATAAQTLESLESQLSIQRGRIEYGNRIGPRCVRRSKDKSGQSGSKLGKKVRSSPALNAKTILDGCKGIRPLENKTLYLTGSLLGLEHDQAVEFLAELGGLVEPTLTSSTDFWIVGTPSSQNQAEDSSAYEAPRAEPDHARLPKPSPTLILSQRQLLALIPGGLDAAKAMM
jgi:DNA polymerase-3 subunit epsilon